MLRIKERKVSSSDDEGYIKVYAKLRIMIRHKRGASAERYVLRGVPMVLHKIHSVKLETLENGRERGKEILR